MLSLSLKMTRLKVKKEKEKEKKKGLKVKDFRGSHELFSFSNLFSRPTNHEPKV